jgi:hypothetical protein
MQHSSLNPSGGLRAAVSAACVPVLATVYGQYSSPLRHTGEKRNFAGSGVGQSSPPDATPDKKPCWRDHVCLGLNGRPGHLPFINWRIPRFAQPGVGLSGRKRFETQANEATLLICRAILCRGLDPMRVSYEGAISSKKKNSLGLSVTLPAGDFCQA